MARAVRPDGLPARTHYRVLERRGDRALVRLELDSADDFREGFRLGVALMLEALGGR